MIAAIVFILILGLLIFVHELGHFLMARRNGIRAEEFGFGFPPRAVGIIRDEETKKFKWVWGGKDIVSDNTVYSINWIPLGGFVKIKGADTMEPGEDSFIGKSAWIRIKVLAAGVVMNFILAWFLISIGLMIGAPEAIDSIAANGNSSKIQISDVQTESPASAMGFKIGDEVLKKQKSGLDFAIVKDVQDYISANKGREITLKIKRGDKILSLSGTPRADAPLGQGPLGISLVETTIIKYPWYQAIWKGLTTVIDLIGAMVVGLFVLIKNILTTQHAGVEVAGPVGIAVMTKQFTSLGLIYVLQFAALLSINLGIINAFPFPALDGGRILFILIEKVKGSPVSQKTEQMFHSVGFVLLILLMLFITFKDVLRFVK
jgi:regulator of sigma E protease